MKILKPKSSWYSYLNIRNLILGIVLLTLIPTSILIIRVTRHRVYNVQIRPAFNVNTKSEENTLSTHTSTKNAILLENIVGQDISELHKIIRELCRLGFKVLLAKEDIDKLANSTKIVSLKCIDIIEDKPLNNNVYVSDVGSIKHILKVIEELEKSSKSEQDKVDKKTNINEQIKIIANNTPNKVSRHPIIPRDLYVKLRRGISEKELNKLPNEYRLLIKVLRDEGLVYVEKGRVYKLVDEYLDLLY